MIEITNRLVNRRSVVVTLMGLLLCFFVADASVAKDQKWNVPKDRGQQAVVEQVDVAGRSITLGAMVYGVSENASLVDADGKRIRLNQLNGLGSPSKPADLVEYWFRKNGRDGRPEITRLKVKPAMSF